MRLYQRVLTPSKNSFFLLGARGTGKSTWVRNIFPCALVIDLLNLEMERSLAAYPERLIKLIERENKSQIIIDEIQKVPKLLEVVHLLIERHKGLQFILTGSSIRKLRQAGVNLLGGRASVRHMHPYMLSELNNEYSLEEALRLGLLPVVLKADDPQDALEAYVSLYINPEIQMEAYVRKMDDFKRFLEVISFSHGSIINLANIAREAHVKRKTAENYLSILEDLLISFKLNVFTKKARRELVAHSKFYLFDAGVFKSLRPKGFRDPIEEINGPAVEGLVAQHLKAWCDYSAGKHQLYYWRTRDQKEVDFVIHGDSGIYAFEVKNSAHIRSDELRSLKIFGEDYPSAQCFLLYRGDRVREIHNIRCIPVEMFLAHLKPVHGDVNGGAIFHTTVT